MAEERSLLYLPQALEEEILVRLPVKSILRFESVCKRWHSLFHSKAFKELYFVSVHHQVSIPTKKDLRLIFPELRGTRSLMWAIGPLSNGIYALISIEKHTLKIALFNPATRRLKFAAPFPKEYLPRLSVISSRGRVVSCGIDDDYRVVVLINHNGSCPMSSRRCFMVFLYTWRTGEWELLIDYDSGQEIIDLPPRTNVFDWIIRLMDDMTACPRKLLNGRWHWLTIYADDDEEVEVNFSIRFHVLSFDFERKSFGLIRGPPCKPSVCADVFVLQDHLAVIVTPQRPSHPLLPNSQLQIWMKKKDPETIWTNIYSVEPSLELRFYYSILYGVDYYEVQEEPELIRIKSFKLLIGCKLFTFDDKGGYQVAEEKQDSDQIPLSLAGISAFRPTLEPLPGSSQVLEHVGLYASIPTDSPNPMYLLLFFILFFVILIMFILISIV